MDCSSPGFSVHGVFQARTLEWVSISSSSNKQWSPLWEGRRIRFNIDGWRCVGLPLVCLCIWHSQLAFANLLNHHSLKVLAVRILLRVSAVLMKPHLKYQAECWGHFWDWAIPKGQKSKAGSGEEYRQVEWQSFGTILLYYSRIFFFLSALSQRGKKRKNNRESLPPSPRKILFPWKVSAIPISLSSLIFGHLTGVSKAALKKVFLNQNISVSLKWRWETNLGKLSLFFMVKKIFK